MPILKVYVSDDTLAILKEYGDRRGVTPEALAEAAVENEAIKTLPPTRMTGASPIHRS